MHQLESDIIPQSFPVGASEFNSLPSTKTTHVVYPDLSNLLNNPDTSLEDVLAHENTLRLFREGHKQIVNYYTYHAEDLLVLAFHPQERMSEKAFEVIIQANISVTNKLILGGIFESHSMKILESDLEPEHLTLHRICYIAYYWVTTSIGYFPTECLIIMKLIKFIRDSCVADFLLTLLVNNPLLLYVQKWLIEEGFPAKLILELESKDEDVEKKRNALLIIQGGLKCKMMQAEFASHEILAAVCNIQSQNPLLNDEIWQTRYDIYRVPDHLDMSFIAQSMIECIKNPISVLRRCHVIVLSMLTDMMKIETDLQAALCSIHFERVILQLIIQFDQNTFMSNACIYFVEEALKIPMMYLEVTKGIIQPVIYEATSNRDNVFLGAIAYGVYNAALETGATNPDLLKYLKSLPRLEFYKKSIFDKKKRKMNQKYGGRWSMAALDLNYSIPCY